MLLSRTLIAGIVAIGLTASLAGCAKSREMGKSARAVFQGGIENSFERSPEQVAQAIDATSKELKLVHISSKTQPSGGQSETIETFRTAKDWKVQIIYTKLSERSCDIEVNTGPFGDSDLRHDIYASLREKLAAMPNPQSPTPSATASAAPTTAPSDSASAATNWAGATGQ